MSTTDAGLRLQYGCGTVAPEGWANFDASPTLRLQRLPLLGPLLTRGRVRFPAAVRYGDVVAGLPVADKSCALVYCSHVLEHLALADLRTALRETYRVLTPGGTFRGVLPDLEPMVADYVARPGPGASRTLVERTMLGFESRPRGLGGLAATIFGNARHLWMWDYEGLAHELAAAGFRDIRRARFGDNPDPALRQVEVRTRWDNCLGFECIR